MTNRVTNGFKTCLKEALQGTFGNTKRSFDMTGKFPQWITEDIRQKLVDHWNTLEFQAKSVTNKANRLSERVAGEGPHTHNTGRHSFSKKKKIMVYFLNIYFRNYIILIYDYFIYI